METENLFHIADVKFGDTIHGNLSWKGGAYKLVAIEDGNRMPIGRLLGTDNEGILYLGKADSFKTRVIELKKSITEGFISSAHECRARYKTSELIREKFPHKNLWIQLIPSDTAIVKESELLKEYIAKYGEAPPLNARNC